MPKNFPLNIFEGKKMGHMLLASILKPCQGYGSRAQPTQLIFWQISGDYKKKIHHTLQVKANKIMKFPLQVENTFVV